MKWINWIMGFLDHPFYSLMLNGVSKGFLGSSRGLRHKDPLFPSLFTLVVYSFSALMAKANSLSLIYGIQVGRDGFTISHL